MKDAQLAPSEKSLTKECEGKDGDRGGSAQTKNCLIRKRKTFLTLPGLLMEGLGLISGRRLINNRPYFIGRQWCIRRCADEEAMTLCSRSPQGSLLAKTR